MSKGNAGISLLKGIQKLSIRKCTAGNNTSLAGKWDGWSNYFPSCLRLWIFQISLAALFLTNFQNIVSWKLFILKEIILIIISFNSSGLRVCIFCNLLSKFVARCSTKLRQICIDTACFYSVYLQSFGGSHTQLFGEVVWIILCKETCKVCTIIFEETWCNFLPSPATTDFSWKNDSKCPSIYMDVSMTSIHHLYVSSRLGSIYSFNQGTEA